MKLKKAFSAAALGLSLISAMPVQATTILTPDGLFNWTGFDWAQAGTAYTTGFQPVAGNLFTVNAFAVAVSLQNGATVLMTPGLDATADGSSTGYEYTLHVLLNESVGTCIGSTTCIFNILSGSYSIYYDLASDANATAGSLGTGFTNGTLLLSGSIGAQAGGSFTATSATSGFGFSPILGTVDTTNLAFINTALTNTVAGTTLQLGDFTANGWVSPGGFNGAAFTADNIVFQADANQSFSSKVPEPASLALFGIAMLAGGAASRRRIKK
jgi:hypothetical protein